MGGQDPDCQDGIGMRLDKDGSIVLSERNLRALLAKLRQPGSARTLVGGSDAPNVVVCSEGDDEHYHDRSPGVVHDETLRLMSEAVDA